MTSLGPSNIGPLTTIFTPSGPDCTSSFIGILPDNKWLQYGVGAAASHACLPPDFRPYENFYYSPGICPSGYTTGCQGQSQISGTKSQTIATCCPVSYSCRMDRGDDPFGCLSCFESSKTFAVSAFFFRINDEGETTRIDQGTTTEVWAGNCVRAYAPVIRLEDGDTFITTPTNTATQTRDGQTISTPTAPTSSATELPLINSNADDDSSSGGLSAGAAAGIGVGCGLAAILIIGAIVFFLMRRRRKQSAEYEPADQAPQPPPTAQASTIVSDYQTPQGYQTYYDPSKSQPGLQPGFQPQAQQPMYELPHQDHFAHELDASR